MLIIEQAKHITHFEEIMTEINMFDLLICKSVYRNLVICLHLKKQAIK